MAGPPLNPDLPASYQIPGVYGYISLLGAGPAPQNKRVLMLGPKTSAGGWPADVPVRVNNEEDANLGAGQGSELVREWRSMQSHGAIGAEIWACPISMTGTAQSRLITILCMPTSDGANGSPRGAVLDTATNTGALAAGVLSVWICWERFDVVVAQGDLYATIAANLNAEILKKQHLLPCTTGVSTATVTLTMRHPTQAAAVLADLPIVVTYSNEAMRINASLGTVTLATNADADTTQSTGHTLLVTTQTAQYAPGNAETPANAAGGFISAINSANAYPVLAARASGSAVMTLFYNNDRVVNRPQVSTLDGSQTVTPAWGVVSTVGNPDLSNAITNIKKQGAFRLYLVGQLAEATSLGTLASHIEQQGNGVNCKGQVVVFADTRALATAGAIPSGTTPALTASPRYIEGWLPAAPNQAYEYAARMAALIVSEDYLPKNESGALLLTDGIVPMGLPHAAVRATDSDCNSAAISYQMTPLRGNSLNQLEIVLARTTAKPSATVDVRYVYWGQIFTVDWMRDDLRSYLWGLLKGKNIKPNGVPVTSNCTTPEAIVDLVRGRLLYWDGLDYYDGAEALMSYVQGAVNVSNNARVDVALPVRVPAPLEQISLYFQNRA